jgi:hypothetical protein
MNTVFIQKDGGFEVSFIWSEDISTLKNLLTAYHEDVLSFGDESLGYYTEDFEAICSACNVVFDEVIIIENDEGCGYDFIKSCVGMLNEQ